MSKKQLLITSGIYLIYVGLILVSNMLMRASISDNNELLEMLSGISFGFVAIPLLSLFLPIYLAKKWKLQHSFWTKTKKNKHVLILGIVFIVVVNFESLKSIIYSGIPLGTVFIHFVSTLLFHTTYYALFGMLVLPVLRKNFSLPVSIIAVSIAFAVYHFAQFYFYPAGTSWEVQIFLFCYFIASMLLYLWSESLIMVAVIHQISASLSLISNGTVHGEIDFLFYLTIPIITIFFGYMILQLVNGKDKDNYDSTFWLKLKSE